MIIEGLKEYESRVIEPRHQETQGELAAIMNLIQQGKGARILAGGLGCLWGQQSGLCCR